MLHNCALSDIEFFCHIHIVHINYKFLIFISLSNEFGIEILGAAIISTPIMGGEVFFI
jgi:hypothetical protein